MFFGIGQASYHKRYAKKRGIVFPMIRIFLPAEQLRSEHIVITGDNARHLALVLRVQPGEIITIFDGQGYRYECTVKQVHKREITVQMSRKEPYSVESPISVVLAQGLPKGDKMDLIIQKATELGTTRIIPLITERSQVKQTNKLVRWKKIALSASRQSGRDRITDISEAVTFSDFLASQMSPPAKAYVEDIKGATLNVLLSEDYKLRNLKELLSRNSSVKEVVLMVGPEGGFSRTEVQTATEKGFTEASLGPRILRTETASLAAISIIQYTLGDMG